MARWAGTWRPFSVAYWRARSRRRRPPPLTSTPTRTAATPCATRPPAATSCATRSATPPPPPTVAAATPFRMQATALGRYLLYGPDGRDAARRRRSTRSRPTATPGPRRRLARRPTAAATLRPDERLDRQAARRGRRSGGWPRSATGPRAGRSRQPRAARHFPEVEVNVTGTALQGLEPDRAGARLPRRPHPPRRLRVPRRPLPLRAAVEPLRRDGRAARTAPTTTPTAPARWSRTSSPPAARSAPTARRAGRASPAGRATSRRRTRAPTGSGSSAPGGRGCGSWSTTWSRTARSASSTRYKQNNCNEMASAYKQAEDMHALQDYIDAQFGGPGKGFFRIVKQPGRGARGDQRRQARRGARDRGVRGARLRAVQRHPEVHDRADRPPSSTSSTSAGVRSLFPVHKFDNALGGTKFDSGAHRRARQHRQQVRDRPVLDGRPLRRPRPRQHHRPRSATAGRRRCHTLFGPVLTQPLFAGPAAGLSARAALQPEGPDARSAST